MTSPSTTTPSSPSSSPKAPTGSPGMESPAIETGLETRIQERGRRIFEIVGEQKPSIFNKHHWTGKVLDWAMEHPEFKVQLLRFVDVFPNLKTGDQINRHVSEYFGEDEQVPALLRLGARTSRFAGAFGGKMIGGVIGKNIREMASQFIIGETHKEALKNIRKLRGDGYAAVVDLLGEAAVSESEAKRYQQIYLDLIAELSAQSLEPLAAGCRTDLPAPLDWGYAPLAQVSVKPTSLYSKARPADFENSVKGILNRLVPIYRKAVECEAALCLDMESHDYKDITMEVFRRLRSAEGLDHWPHLAVVLQAYLKETEDDLRGLLTWMREHKLPSAIRLVKGAYWDYETILAEQENLECPVWTQKAETDANFERCSRLLLENTDICYFQCGTHNIRSIAATLEMARDLKVPEDRYEFQVLYGMAEPVRQALLEQAGRVRLYCPYGELIPGMAYLVRRLLENTANESFLRQGFHEGMDTARLLANPADLIVPAERPAEPAASRPGFVNHPAADFTDAAQRAAFPEAIEQIRARELGRTVALHIGGEDVTTGEAHPVHNPNQTAEHLADVSQAGRAHAGHAMEAAARAFPKWRDRSFEDRAAALEKAAQAAREDFYRLAAWQVLEVGKQWDQAHADVAEAIDFLEYYAAEARRLGPPQRLGNVPGETNDYFYEGRGVAVVIAPWNFPLAISMGMVSAALAAGNTVVYKPSNLSAVTGRQIVDLFRKAKLPDGVLNFVPGRGSVIGDFLVEHPDTATIAFTGSKETGLRIIQKASVVQPGQRLVKRVIAEMGGKNAIIVDDDADLDEAVPAVLYSAFGFQGQKCSACSRVIVPDSAYDRFVARLVEAAKGWEIGPSEDPRYRMGAVVDAAALKKIRSLINVAYGEGEKLYESAIPDGGHYAPITIVGNITPAHRIAQEEVFGPVLAVMRARDFAEAIDWANRTEFALTGGVFSRSPKHLEQARSEFRVGNLYLNRGITGALVGRQAFGGSAMSGVGSKAGGPDYLRQFMDPRVVTENTMRRGFAPGEEG